VRTGQKKRKEQRAEKSEERQPGADSDSREPGAGSREPGASTERQRKRLCREKAKSESDYAEEHRAKSESD